MEEKRRNRWLDIVYLLLLLAFLFMAIFCLSKPRVGVVDIARVAREVGMTDRILADSRLQENLATKQMQGIQADFAQKEKDIREQLQAAKTDEERQEVRKQMATVSLKIQKDSADVQNALARHKLSVTRTFLSRLQPYIADIATRKHLQVVLKTGGNVVYAVAKVDVTSDVVEASRDYFAKEAALLPDENEEPAADATQDEQQEPISQ